MAKRKVSIEEEARTALQEEKEIQTETANIIITEDEVVYASPEEPADNPFAVYQQQIEAAGMTFEDEQEPQVEPQKQEKSLTFPKLEDLDISSLPEADSPEGNINAQEMVQSMSAEDFFQDNMGEEEIADWYMYLAEEGVHPFIQTPDGDEIEVVQSAEQPQHKEPEESPLQPEEKLSREDKKTPVSIYLNGKEITKAEFVAEIHKHKEMYLAVLREQYPKVKTMIEKDTARQDIIMKRFEMYGKSKTEPQSKEDRTVVKALKKEQAKGRELQTPAQAAGKRLTDIEMKIKRGEEKVKQKDEVLYAKNKLLLPAQNGMSIEVNFTGSSGEIEHNAKLSKGKDGKMYFQLDGKRTNEEELKKVVEIYPGQLKAAVDFKAKMMDRDERSR